MPTQYSTLLATFLTAHYSSSQERASLAEKIVKSQDSEARTAASNNWYAKAAESAGIELDGVALFEEGEGGSDTKDRQRFKEAAQAKKRLATLLSQPMMKQRFGKFLSTAGAQASIAMEESVTPYLVGGNVVGSLKRGRGGEPVKLNKHGKPKRRRK